MKVINENQQHSPIIEKCTLFIHHEPPYVSTSYAKIRSNLSARSDLENYQVSGMRTTTKMMMVILATIPSLIPNIKLLIYYSDQGARVNIPSDGIHVASVSPRR